MNSFHIIQTDWLAACHRVPLTSAGKIQNTRREEVTKCTNREVNLVEEIGKIKGTNFPRNEYLSHFPTLPKSFPHCSKYFPHFPRWLGKENHRDDSHCFSSFILSYKFTTPRRSTCTDQTTHLNTYSHYLSRSFGLPIQLLSRSSSVSIPGIVLT